MSIVEIMVTFLRDQLVCGARSVFRVAFLEAGLSCQLAYIIEVGKLQPSGLASIPTSMQTPWSGLFHRVEGRRRLRIGRWLNAIDM